MIRALDASEISSAAFRHLVWLAAELEEVDVTRLIDTELPHLTVQGMVSDGEVRGFIALAETPHRITVEYIAVATDAQGQGLGRRFIEEARRIADGRAVFAETDDDAVDFYRRLGFTIAESAPDPRWPERRRYACTRAVEPQGAAIG